MEFKDLVEKLVRLGFSGYEAKAYISLLKRNPTTGYELAKSSGIPPSKVYDVISKLLARSIISPLPGKPVKYEPQDTGIFLKNLRKEFRGTIDSLDENLKELGDGGFDYIWNINDMHDFMKRAREMVVNAKENIIVLGWDSELRELMAELRQNRVEKKAIIQFGSMHIDIGVVYNHGIEKVLESEKGGRIFSIVADGASLLQGIISESNQVRGINTSHPSLVEMGADYMIHEIYVVKMYDRFAEEMDRKFGGKNLHKLRNIWER